MKFFGILLSLGSFMVLNVAADNSWNYGGEIKIFFIYPAMFSFYFCTEKTPKAESPCKLKPTLSK